MGGVLAYDSPIILSEAGSPALDSAKPILLQDWDETRG